MILLDTTAKKIVFFWSFLLLFSFLSPSHGQSVIGKWKFYDAQIDTSVVDINETHEDFVRTIVSVRDNTKKSLKGSTIEFKTDGRFTSSDGLPGLSIYKVNGKRLSIFIKKEGAMMEEKYVVVRLNNATLTLVPLDMGVPVLLIYRRMK